MKKIVVLILALMMFTPNGFAYAASEMCTSKSFTIRNCKGIAPESADGIEEVTEDTENPVEDHSEEIEEQAKPVEGEQSVPDNSGAIEPEDQTGQEEPEDGGSAETIDTPVDESEDSVDVAVIDVPPAVMDTKDEPDGGPDGG